jgi:oxygen-independent coproporphyrinogen-3 oxidase
VLRQQRWREPAQYMERALAGEALSQDQEVARAELPFEFMLNALRLREGVPRELFGERTGMPASAIDMAVLKAQQRGLLETDLQMLRPTALGFDFLSELQAMFLPARAPNR